MSVANINMPGNTLKYYIGKWSLLEAAETLWYNDSMQSGNGGKKAWSIECKTRPLTWLSSL